MHKCFKHKEIDCCDTKVSLFLVKRIGCICIDSIFLEKRTFGPQHLTFSMIQEGVYCRFCCASLASKLQLDFLTALMNVKHKLAAAKANSTALQGPYILDGEPSRKRAGCRAVDRRAAMYC